MSKRIELSIPYEAATMFAFGGALQESAKAFIGVGGRPSFTPPEKVTSGDASRQIGKVEELGLGYSLPPGPVETTFSTLLHAIKTIEVGALDSVPAKVVTDLKNVVKLFETTEVKIATVAIGDKKFDVSETETAAEIEAKISAGDGGTAVITESDKAAVEAFGDEEPPPPPPAEDDAPPPPPPPADVELDAAGLPFDARIHGSGRTVYAASSGSAAGCWKLKRKVDPELVIKVEAELRAALAVPGPTAEQLEELPPTEIATLSDFITACTAKGLDPATVTEAIKKHGIEGVPVLATRPDLIPVIAAELEL